MKQRRLGFLIFLTLFIFWPPRVFSAGGVFTVSPAKIETVIAAGETKFENLTIVNNLGRTATFNLRAEAIGPTTDPKIGVRLVNGNLPVDSVVPYLELPQPTVTLAAGEQLTVPIIITLPTRVSPGSLHGAVIVSATASTDSSANARIQSRAGVLFFVRVPGIATVDGRLVKFGLLDGLIRFDQLAPLVFYLNYENTGNTYLNPYGLIKIKSLTGKIVSQSVIDPWFILPAARRTRDFTVADFNRLGIFKAELSLNRGYNDLIDQSNLFFVVISPILAGGLAILILILGGFLFVLKLRR